MPEDIPPWRRDVKGVRHGPWTSGITRQLVAQMCLWQWRGAKEGRGNTYKVTGARCLQQRHVEGVRVVHPRPPQDLTTHFDRAHTQAQWQTS